MGWSSVELGRRHLLSSPSSLRRDSQHHQLDDLRRPTQASYDRVHSVAACVSQGLTDRETDWFKEDLPADLFLDVDDLPQSFDESIIREICDV